MIESAPSGNRRVDIGIRTIQFGCQRGPSPFDQAGRQRRLDIAMDAPIITTDRLGQGPNTRNVMPVNVPQQRDARRRQHAEERLPVLEADMGFWLRPVACLCALRGCENPPRVVRESATDMDVHPADGDRPMTCSMVAAKSCNGFSKVVDRCADSATLPWAIIPRQYEKCGLARSWRRRRFKRRTRLAGRQLRRRREPWRSVPPWHAPPRVSAL